LKDKELLHAHDGRDASVLERGKNEGEELDGIGESGELAELKELRVKDYQR